MGRMPAFWGGLVTVVVVGALAVPAGGAGAAEGTEPGPLRVLLVGDSITMSYQDEAAAALSAKGYAVMINAVGGSGLRDRWACHGNRAKMLRLWDADVVVFQSIGNYGMLPPCTDTPRGTRKFYRQWTNEAEAAQRIMTRDGGRFLWILNPQTDPPRATAVFDEIYLGVAGTQAEIVDAWSAFGGWTYNSSLHTADGVHLNQDGQRRLADLVVAAVG